MPLDGEPSRRISRRQQLDALRGPKVLVDPEHPAAVIHEWEALVGAAGADARAMDLAEVACVILVGAECALRCKMCDLWRHTLDQATAKGALPRQLRWALGQRSISPRQPLPTAGTARGNWIKLYNASNFFDPRCVPPADWGAIASEVVSFDRVIVENHPRVRPGDANEFAKLIPGQLEIAVGLEAADDEILRGLDKRMRLRDFSAATENWRYAGIDVRAFLLLGPPGCPRDRALDLVLDTLRFAASRGVRHASVIPTRTPPPGQVALNCSAPFTPPTAADLEAALLAALQLRLAMVVTVDLWDWEKLVGQCEACRDRRRARLTLMNLNQQPQPRASVDCDCLIG